MSDIIRKQLLAQAAWLEMEGAIKAIEAAALRGDREAEISARQKAHDMLDSHLDMKCEALVAVLKAGGQ